MKKSENGYKVNLEQKMQELESKINDKDMQLKQKNGAIDKLEKRGIFI